MSVLNTKNLFGIAFLLFINNFFSQEIDYKLKKIIANTKKAMQPNYILEKEEICDLNNDNKKDIIFIYKTKNIDKEIETLDSPVILLLSTNDTYIKIENSNILYSFIPNNSVLDNNLVIKNEFFTLEQTEGDGNNKKIIYITFKFDKYSKQIFLSKYGVETFFPDENKIIKKTQIFSEKDFGKIKFEDYSNDAFQNKINKNK
ncbi:hypothetical protein [Chryseobacterium gregarium]|uniref:hypothetical protein n=1 Tax=Chryseobacterium gregarium TaxID=456299 RepID=UPI000480F817|nr:hypothetical protein [Chryseobacterium gregarium]